LAVQARTIREICRELNLYLGEHGLSYGLDYQFKWAPKPALVTDSVKARDLAALHLRRRPMVNGRTFIFPL
jgi:hypothetical protein